MKKELTDSYFYHQVDFENSLLPFKRFETQVQNGQPDILFHWHNECEMSYVETGSARYHIDYEYFDSQPGDLIFIRPNATHSIHPIERKEHKTQSILFHLDFLGATHLDQTSLNYLQPLQTDKAKFISRIQPQDPGYEQIKNCFFQILALDLEVDYYELLLKGKLFELFHLLFSFSYVVEKRTDDLYRKNESLRGLIDYIHNHYEENLSMDLLAQQMGYSKAHFMAVFKQHMGISCMEFIIQVRLRAACELLATSMKPIVDIAHQVGFNNLSNFNRQFKKSHHLTPSQYRKQFRKQV